MPMPLWMLNPMLRLLVKAPLGWIGSPQQFRARFERDARMIFRMPEGVTQVPEVLRAPGAADLPAVWLSLGRPDRRRVLLYLHGGAYVAGSPRTHAHLAARLAGEAGMRALLPDYRLAPEHPFPAAVEDALTAWRHLITAGYPPEGLALAGDSAGGGLVFALLQRIAAEGLPTPAAVVAFSPWADMTMQAPSLSRNARRDVMLPVRRMAEVVGHYLQGADPADPLASPALGKYRDPPPALIAASDAEILTDDARRMAEVLSRAGGDVQLEIWKGLPHAWPVFCGRLWEADEAVRMAGRFLASNTGGAEDGAG